MVESCVMTRRDGAVIPSHEWTTAQVWRSRCASSKPSGAGARERHAEASGSNYKLIGTPASGSISPARFNGAAVYGIDAKVPGMKIATLAILAHFRRCCLRKLDDNAARAVPACARFVRLDDAVAVVADHMWAAKKGLAALQIEWDEGPNAKVSHSGHRGGHGGGFHQARCDRAPRG